MLNPAPELQQAVEAVEVAKNHLDYAQCDKMIDAAIHELQAAKWAERNCCFGRESS